jgi:E3 ubiquitin-protein ligase BRE1
MTTIQAAAVSNPLLTLNRGPGKMEDRKRSLAATDADEMAPSRKRMLKDESGQQIRMDAEKEKDIEVCDVLFCPSFACPSQESRLT